jgi:hypothetical protein
MLVRSLACLDMENVPYKIELGSNGEMMIVVAEPLPSLRSDPAPKVQHPFVTSERHRWELHEFLIVVRLVVVDVLGLDLTPLSIGTGTPSTRLHVDT